MLGETPSKATTNMSLTARARSATGFHCHDAQSKFSDAANIMTVETTRLPRAVLLLRDKPKPHRIGNSVLYRLALRGVLNFFAKLLREPLHVIHFIPRPPSCF